MPFRSVEFGDSIINMKSMLTAQSPWWYQLKTAPFSWHFSRRCFFPFFRVFLLWQIFSMALLAPLPPRTCAMLQPQARFLGQWGSTLPSPLTARFLCLSSCSIWPDVSGGIWVQALFVSPCGDRQSLLCCPQQKALWCPPPRSLLLQRLRAATADHLINFMVRPQLIFIIFLFQSVFQVFLECHEWRAGIRTKCPVLNPIYMQKLCQFYPEVKSVQTPSVRTLLN